DGGDRLARPARGDQRADPREVAGVGEHTGGGNDDAFGLGEAAGADVTAGEARLLGVDDADAARAQLGEVVLDGGVLPHLGVHRRGEDHGRFRREQRRGEQVVRDAVGVLADEVGGGGGDHDDVGGAAELRVPDQV